jgi:hypothetical protein
MPLSWAQLGPCNQLIGNNPEMLMSLLGQSVSKVEEEEEATETSDGGEGKIGLRIIENSINRRGKTLLQ